jgi:hypothetical protein
MIGAGERGWPTWLTRTLMFAALSGLFLGIGARVVMRFVALEAGMSYGASLGGAIEVVAFGTMVGAPAAWVFFVLRRRIPLARPWAGLAYGLLLLGLLAAVPPRAARAALADTPDTPAATAVAFALLFVGWGLLLEYVIRPLLPGDTSAPGSGEGR